ncbi:MAG TPA: hypothetical protein PLP29_05915 [Candidatus Ozemobacteraceae bacterium]|nr:hypothetical protein [Candidatus Ozemobacteraceae bacterium]
MVDEQKANALPEEANRKRKMTKRERDLEIEAMKSRMSPDELANAHKKFMMIMIGLFVLVLVLMLAFNQHVDFMSDGGM